jgi:hypothetical protein
MKNGWVHRFCRRLGLKQLDRDSPKQGRRRSPGMDYSSSEMFGHSTSLGSGPGKKCRSSSASDKLNSEGGKRFVLASPILEGLYGMIETIGQRQKNGWVSTTITPIPCQWWWSKVTDWVGALLVQVGRTWCSRQTLVCSQSCRLRDPWSLLTSILPRPPLPVYRVLLKESEWNRSSKVRKRERSCFSTGRLETWSGTLAGFFGLARSFSWATPLKWVGRCFGRGTLLFKLRKESGVTFSLPPSSLNGAILGIQSGLVKKRGLFGNYGIMLWPLMNGGVGSQHRLIGPTWFVIPELLRVCYIDFGSVTRLKKAGPFPFVSWNSLVVGVSLLSKDVLTWSKHCLRIECLVDSGKLIDFGFWSEGWLSGLFGLLEMILCSTRSVGPVTGLKRPSRLASWSTGRLRGGRFVATGPSIRRATPKLWNYLTPIGASMIPCVGGMARRSTGICIPSLGLGWGRVLSLVSVWPGCCYWLPVVL